MVVITWFHKFLTKAKSVVVFLLITAVFFGLLFCIDTIFRIKEITVDDNGQKQFISGLNDFKNQNLILISPKDIALKIKEKNPTIKDVQVNKKYPNILELSFDFYDPSAEINVAGGYFILSSDGRILSKNKNKGGLLPLISYYQKLDYYSYSAGDYLDINDIKTAISFIQSLKDLGLQVESLDINDKDMLLCNVGDKKIIFSAEKNIALQQYELQQIVRQFKIQGKEYQSIDLRFDKPVVKF